MEEIKEEIVEPVLLDDLLVKLGMTRKEFAKQTGVKIDKIYGKKNIATIGDIENVFKYLYTKHNLNVDCIYLLGL